MAINPQLMSWEQAVAWARQEPSMAGLVQVCYYDDPIEAAAARFLTSEEWPAITGFLPPKPSARVLELGAGRGIVSWAFATCGCEVYAIEPDPSTLVGAGAIRRLCMATGQSIGIIESAGGKLNFADGYFDYVLCRGVLHHVSNLEQVCREIFRVLRPGGRFLAIKEHSADSPEELAAFLRSHPLHHLYGGEHAFPLATYKQCIYDAGFRRLRTFSQFNHPITSAPAVTSGAIRGMIERALRKIMPQGLAARFAKMGFVERAYRRWMTWNSQAPGPMHTFFAQKPE
jgi:ubiquinone/menaquinone biosynthesis C-methylase UbiE